MTPLQKSILATALLGVAAAQVYTICLALGIIGRLQPRNRRRAAFWHRTGGIIGLAIALIIAYYCLKLWPYGVRTTRIWIHATLGTFLLGLMAVKVTIRNGLKRYYSRLPVLGVVLAVTVILQWLISAGWYLFLAPPGY